MLGPYKIILNRASSDCGAAFCKVSSVNVLLNVKGLAEHFLPHYFYCFCQMHDITITVMITVVEQSFGSYHSCRVSKITLLQPG